MVKNLWLITASSFIKDLTPLRTILRRWLKVDFTMALNSFSSQASCLVLLRVKRITADFTFGGGVKALGSTVNKYSIS